MSVFHNQTRRSASIPSRLINEGRFYLVPLYYLMRTSDLAREGIANSASYRFADHIYAGRASGRYGIGNLLDALFLRFPSARAMRFRCTAARDEIIRLATSGGSALPIDVLAVPCGLGRELFAAAEALADREEVGAAPAARWHGMDLDGQLVAHLQERARGLPYPMCFRRGDALDPASYGEGAYTMIISTGFTEFLSDEQVVHFFSILRSRLGRDGVLFTSAMLPHRVSDFLLRTLGEIDTHYRSRVAIVSLIDAAGLQPCTTYSDPTGLQTIVLARPRA